MNKIAPLLLILLFLGCKKEKDPEPSPIIKEIVGKWRLIARGYIRNGILVKEAVNFESHLIFRFDGVMLDGDELPECCRPDSLIVNGNPFKIKPLAPVPNNPSCALFNCIICDYLDVVQNGNTLVTKLDCFGDYSSFYVRE